MNTPAEIGLVLLPGLDGTGRLFAPLLKVLPANLEVTVAEYPPEQPLNNLQLAEHIRASLPRDRPVVLCAESFSGPIAVELACAGTLDIRGIMFCATFTHSPRPLLLSLSGLLPLSILFRIPIPNAVLRFLLLGRKAEDSLIRLFRQSISEVDANVLAGRLRQVAAVDVRSKLKVIKVPCCYIVAKSDKLVPPSCLRFFQKGVPGLRVKEIDGPHFILQAKPIACSRAIGDFMNLLAE